MEKIVEWLMGCDYSREEAIKEANVMIHRNQLEQGQIYYTREQAIEFILYDLGL